MTETIEHNATTQPDTPAVSAKPRLLDQMREIIRVKHYSLRTEKTYIGWVRQLIRWSGMRNQPRANWATAESRWMDCRCFGRGQPIGGNRRTRAAIWYALLRCYSPRLSGWTGKHSRPPTHKVTRRASARSLLTAVLGSVFALQHIFISPLTMFDCALQ